jgi:hypothetical protein
MSHGIKRKSPSEEDSSTQQQSSRQRTQAKSMFTIVNQDLKSTDATVVEEGLKLLKTELWIQCKRKLAGKQQEFLDVDGAACVIRVMLQSPNNLNKNIQENGLRVLTSATHCNDDVRLAVSKANGMQAMIMAMKTHRLNQTIHFFGIKAIKNLCYLESLSHLFVHRLGAVPFLVDIMKKFAKDPNISKVSCELVLLLCQNKKLRKLLLAANVASALAAAAEYFVGRDTETAALHALYSLTSV